MTKKRHSPLLALALATAMAVTSGAGRAQEAVAPLPKDYILLTVFFKHDESRPLPELNKDLEQRNWARYFPPAGVEVESWYIMMGVGQVVTLRVPPEKVRE